jgi:DNA polymerase I-like protein with 3'-5' exonuclease and polymerase domains
MIYFVTQRKEEYLKLINTKLFADIEIINVEEGTSLYQKLLSKQKVLAYDVEASGLDPYLSDLLLVGIGNKHVQFMYDYTAYPIDILKDIVRRNKVLLGTNLKYDIKMTKVHTGIFFTNVFDVMLAEQRLYMGAGLEFGYENLVERYLKKMIMKGTRNDFIGKKKETFNINASHLYYLRTDLVDLFEIRRQQQAKIKRFNIEFLVYGIEFPLISVVAEAELEGFTLNVDKWLERYEKELQENYEVLVKLDEEVRRLRSLKAKEIEETFGDLADLLPISKGKWDRPRVRNRMNEMFNKDGSTDIMDLFGETMNKKTLTGTKQQVKLYPNNINYNSPNQMIALFAVLEEPLITEKEDFFVPQLDEKGKPKKLRKPSFKAELIEKYRQLKPKSKMIPFLNLYTKHKKLEKSINTYGKSFITYINPVTGKLHTTFRQCFADTGRFQSGGGDKEPDKPNFQNIPKSNDYRNCFTVDTTKYSVCTADYSGAELIVMCSHAQDQKLLEISKGDMHSYMATKCWRAIYAYRAEKMLEFIAKATTGGFGNLTDKQLMDMKETYKDYAEKAKSFTVSKETPKLRTDFKPMVFGTIYGMYATKAGMTLNIAKEEGQIVINIIKKEFPATFKMVEAASQYAKQHGYVILDYRTNARAWFPDLLRLRKGIYNEKEHFQDISKAMSEARNARIQGTQATFVKEASVVLGKYIRINNIDAKQLSWVHDEIITRVPRHLDGRSDEWCEYYKHNPKALTSPFSGKTGLSLPQVKKEIMTTIANRYLRNVSIDVEVQTEDYWIK